MRSTRISVGKSLIVGKRAVEPAPTQPKNNEALVAQQTTNSGTVLETVTKTVNEYYRVRSGDNLGKIAQKNRVTIAQLKSWNGLKSDKISVGKNLIVRKKTVEVEQPKPVQEVAETATKPKESSSIISNYLKNQLEGADSDDAEVVTDASTETE